MQRKVVRNEIISNGNQASKQRQTDIHTALFPRFVPAVKLPKLSIDINCKCFKVQGKYLSLCS